MSSLALEKLLIRAQSLGFIGPGPPTDQLKHAESFVALVLASYSDPPAAHNFLDLGSGGGLPGLVLALAAPDWRGYLLDAQERRTIFLTEAVAELGLSDRIKVIRERAEAAARNTEYRSQFSLVVARSFASPPITAECAVGFLAPGGRLVVSESPADTEKSLERWPTKGLEQLGFSPVMINEGELARTATTELATKVSDRWPRRTGIPAKRPIW